MRKLVLCFAIAGSAAVYAGCDTSADKRAVTPDKTVTLPNSKPNPNAGQGLKSEPPPAN